MMLFFIPLPFLIIYQISEGYILTAFRSLPAIFARLRSNLVSRQGCPYRDLQTTLVSRPLPRTPNALTNTGVDTCSRVYRTPATSLSAPHPVPAPSYRGGENESVQRQPESFAGVPRKSPVPVANNASCHAMSATDKSNSKLLPHCIDARLDLAIHRDQGAPLTRRFARPFIGRVDGHF